MDPDFDMAKEFEDFLGSSQDQPMPGIEQEIPLAAVIPASPWTSFFNPSRGVASEWQPAPLPEVAPQVEVSQAAVKPERISQEVQFPEPEAPAPVIEQPVEQLVEQPEPSHLPGQPNRQRIPIHALRPAPTPTQSTPTLAQRATLHRSMAAAGRAVPSSSTAGPSSRNNTWNIAIPSGTSAGRPRRSTNEGLWVPDDPAQVELSMNDGQEDHSWMEDDGNNVDEEYETMTRLRDLLQRKEKSGKMNEREKMELYKVRQKIVSIPGDSCWQNLSHNVAHFSLAERQY